MKRILWTLVAVCLIGGTAAAGNVVDLGINSTTDTIFADQANEFLISLENDVTLGGLGLGFHIWSPDDASWTWNAQSEGLGSNQILTVVPGSRMSPPNTVWDLGGMQITDTTLDGISPDTIMFGGAALNGGLASGPLEHMISLHFTPNLPTAVDEGIICIDSTYVPPAGSFVFVDAGGGTFVPSVAWSEGGRCYVVDKIENQCPEFVSGNPSTMSVSHCGSNSVVLSATDFEGDAIQFGISANTGNGTATVTNHNDGTCTVNYTATGADIGAAVSVTVYATDASHNATGCTAHTITITATNNTPTIDCGSVFERTIDNVLFTKSDIIGSDVDACDNLTFELLNGPGQIDAETGVYTWMPNEMDHGVVHTITVSVGDGFQSDECSFNVEVLGLDVFMVKIEKYHDVYQGQYTNLPIKMIAASETMGGFDFLIHYDESILTFTQASLGDHLVECNWEYFTYRHSWNGNCGTGCPSGEIRLVGLAETNNGPYHPDYSCINIASNNDAALVNLQFYVTSDVNANGQFAQVKFFWMDCGDNTISVVSGDTLAVSRNVYNYYGENGTDTYVDVTDTDTDFPTWYGAPETCITQFTPGTDKIPPVRFVDFYNGGIDIIDKDKIDDRGDINQNGISNEIADAVMLTNFFIYGESAFNNHVAASLAASDINADGTPVTIADLVYLTRIIVGDAQPYPKPVPDAHFDATFDGETIRISTDVDAGAALFVFDIDGTVGKPTVNDNLKILSDVIGGRLRLLVYDIGTTPITSATEITIPVEGKAELISVEAATYQGAELDATIRTLPRTFTAHQNYPNPFNPKTTISFDLNMASEWTVDIYNIAGQKVSQFRGISEPGTVQVVWDSKDAAGQAVASGIYFYKISAGDNTVTRQMVLLK
ncbi:MAG: T9SS type A sorting domain-containing protein [Candidatus Zixiibacteriota bacterium]